MQACDLIVIGAGPAGSSAAISAARWGSRVLLLEKGTLPRHKVCGEFVSPEAVTLLSELFRGSESLFLLRNAHRVSRARMFVDENVIEAPVEPAGVSITRHDLDLALFRSAQAAGADARMGVSVESLRHQDGEYDVVTSEGVFRSRAVINASGRWSNLKRRSAPEGPCWVGIKAHYRELSPPDSVDLYFFDGGYCGVQALGSGVVNACAMVRMDVGTTLEAVFGQHEHLAQRSRAWEALIPQVSTAPVLFHRPLLHEEGVINAGDAAGFVDPFVGDGISIALHSGAMAADSLRPWLRREAPLAASLERYTELYRQNLRPVFRRAALLRWVLSLPRPLRAPMLNLMRSSRVARMVVEKTRAL